MTEEDRRQSESAASPTQEKLEQHEKGSNSKIMNNSETGKTREVSPEKYKY